MADIIVRILITYIYIKFEYLYSIRYSSFKSEIAGYHKIARPSIAASKKNFHSRTLLLAACLYIRKQRCIVSDAKERIVGVEQREKRRRRRIRKKFTLNLARSANLIVRTDRLIAPEP